MPAFSYVSVEPPPPMTGQSGAAGHAKNSAASAQSALGVNGPLLAGGIIAASVGIGFIGATTCYLVAKRDHAGGRLNIKRRRGPTGLQASTVLRAASEAVRKTSPPRDEQSSRDEQQDEKNGEKAAVPETTSLRGGSQLRPALSSDLAEHLDELDKKARGVVDPDTGIYREPQLENLCGMHALNSVLHAIRPKAVPLRPSDFVARGMGKILRKTSSNPELRAHDAGFELDARNHVQVSTSGNRYQEPHVDHLAELLREGGAAQAEPVHLFRKGWDASRLGPAMDAIPRPAAFVVLEHDHYTALVRDRHGAWRSVDSLSAARQRGHFGFGRDGWSALQTSLRGHHPDAIVAVR